jgi:hypothetical protein
MLLNKSKNSAVSRNRLSYIQIHGTPLSDLARNIHARHFFTLLEYSIFKQSIFFSYLYVMYYKRLMLVYLCVLAVIRVSQEQEQMVSTINCSGY